MDELLYISACGTCTEYDQGLADYSNDQVAVIKAASRGKVRFTTRLHVQTFMAAVGLLAVYFLLRNLARTQVVIRATL